MLATAPDHQDSWFFDTGATHHLSHSAQTLSHVQPYSGADQVTIGDGHSLPILNTAFKPYLEAHGIVHQFSCPHTSQQNGRAERKIRHLVETSMALLAQSFLHSKYWSFAFQTSVYLINLLPAKLLNFQSPLQAMPQLTKVTFVLMSPLVVYTYPEMFSFMNPLFHFSQYLLLHPSHSTLLSHSLPPLLQVPFAPTPSPTPSSSPSPLNTHSMVTRAKSGIHKKKSFLMQTTSEPHTYSQAFKSEPWVQAMQHEYQALLPNHTWSLVPPPLSAHIVDVENAFLDGDLQEEAPRAWFQKPQVALVDYAFQSSRADTSLFIHHTTSDILILLVYVDDILVTGSNPKLVSHFISYLHEKFALRDLGPLSYFLGIQAQQQGSVLHLNQQKYIADLLHRTQMEAFKPTPTLGNLGCTLSQSDGVPLPNPSEYRRIVGALQYVHYKKKGLH
ncbi:Retrovirus-related Pol polyprotein from transposon RE2 [Vitis vinifera]|uniref:Retrovirus-related Pol polyprotein from transposon RE2 n=1 Tax=Vitis vinifera TaxID=29760 RepID=A0A438C455_VITVI|nr:Retrovirus-related Pol polyprotein from transposon RE2 [Vitis vinifera]